MDILFIGHSLIEFFDWQYRFPGHRVANLGVAGESVEGLLSRIDKITGKYRSADFIFIMSGINNMAMANGSDREDFEFFDAYRDIVKKLKNAYPGARICINSLLPVLVDFIPDDAVRRVNRALGELAENTGAEYLDIYGLFTDADGKPVEAYLLDDGVHLSGKGYYVWSGALERIINE